MQTPNSGLETHRKIDIMIVQTIILCLLGTMLCTQAGAIGPEEGRSLGVFRPFGGGGQTVHYERYGGIGGGFPLKYPGYGYESYTLSGGGFGKPFHGPGFGYGGGYGYGGGFFPGPFIPHPGFGGGFGHGYGFGHGFGHGFGPGFGHGFGYFK